VASILRKFSPKPGEKTREREGRLDRLSASIASLARRANFDIAPHFRWKSPHSGTTESKAILFARINRKLEVKDET
jgi:hypothetical protein